MEKASAPHAKRADASAGHDVDRRGFGIKFFTLAIGAPLAIVPLAAGLLTFFDPLWRRRDKSAFVRIAPLSALPPDGIPRRFQVVAERHDAWNRYPPQPIGAVYLRRTSEDGPVEALNVVCPHAGCFVNYMAEADDYKCPCHDSRFTVEGGRIDPEHCPSPRDLDSLECEVRQDGERADIWVKFENFRKGTPEKIVQA